MQRIMIERNVPTRRDRETYAPLPLDPRDPDILRAKQLLRRQALGAAQGSMTERVA